jgi:Rrf2 family transcriptional regulator, nitric oxide-sensitive transcriptional repressor
MKLTKQTDYSLRVLIFLGTHEGSPATIDQVAAAYNISRNHLMKVVHHLATGGLLDTQRGRSGGFRLAKAPAEIRVGDVVRMTEPDFAVVECLGEGSCTIDGPCKLKGILRDLTEEWLNALNRYTLADLLEPRSSLVQLLSQNK